MFYAPQKIHSLPEVEATHVVLGLCSLGLIKFVVAFSVWIQPQMHILSLITLHWARIYGLRNVLASLFQLDHRDVRTTLLYSSPTKPGADNPVSNEMWRLLPRFAMDVPSSRSGIYCICDKPMLSVQIELTWMLV